MSFGEELLKALSATQYRAAESPYAMAGQAVNAVTPNLVNPYGSMGSNLGIAAGSGILAALLTGLAENDATRRNTEFAPSISAFMDADPTQQAQLAAKEPRLSSLYNVLQANALTNDMELKQKIAEKTGLMPYVAEEEKQKYLATQPYKQEEDLLKQSNQLLGAEGKMMIPGQGIVDVTNPMQRAIDLDAEKIKNELLKSQGQVRLGNRLEQVIPKIGNADIFKEEDAARTELKTKTPSVIQFELMQKSLPLLAGFKDQDTKSSDFGFIYNFVKANDDGAVRNEEINLAQSANPLLQKYKETIEGAIKGTSQITPDLKNQMYNELKSAQKNLYEQAVLDIQRRFDISKQRGVEKIENISPLDLSLKFEETINPQSAALAELKRRGLIP